MTNLAYIADQRHPLQVADLRKSIVRHYERLAAIALVAVVSGCGPRSDGSSVESGSTPGDRQVRLATVAAAQARYEDAFTHLDSARVFGAAPADILFARGRISFELSRLDDAERAYREVGGLNPDYPGVWHNLGNIAFRRNQFREALALYQRSVQVDRSAQTLHAIGGTYLKLGQADSARMALDQSLAEDAEYAPASFSYSELLELSGEYDDALQRAETALALQPENPGFRQQVGSLQLRVGRAEDAVESLRPVVAAQPWNPEALFGLANALRATGSPDADRVLRRAEELREAQSQLDIAEAYSVENPESFKRVVAYADLLREAGRLADALRSYQAAAILRPADVNVQNNIATLYVQLGNADEAYRRYVGLLRADSTIAEAWLNLGILHARAGRKDSALNAFAAARRHAGENQSVLGALERLQPRDQR